MSILQSRPAHLSSAVAGSVLLLALIPPITTAAQAQPVIDAPEVASLTTGTVDQARPGAYGGGFLELVITGRDPTQNRVAATQAARTAPRGAPWDQFERRSAARGAPWDGFEAEAQPMPARGGARHAALQQPSAYRPAMAGPDPKFARQEVAYDGPHKPGTIVVDTPRRFLFLVQDNGRALRYGIGVGRPGFEWAGFKAVTRKAQWPDWRPPAEMLKRRPDLPRFMPGGENNPLGARALYLGSSLYRIHGTNEPNTIGQAVSSGCIRMLNDDVVDLYERVRVGSSVFVI